jgi:hypothetical protein
MPGYESTIRHDDKAATRLAPQGDDGRFDLCVVSFEPSTEGLRAPQFR